MLQGVWNINFFCQSLKITSDILRYIRYSALKCHLAAAFCFIINVAWFIFSDLSSDAWAFSCVYTKRYIIYGQNSQSQEFQQNNLLKSCIGSLVESENCNRTASPPDLAHCAGVPSLDAHGQTVIISAQIALHISPHYKYTWKWKYKFISDMNKFLCSICCIH